MRPDRYIHLIPTSSPVSGPESCTDPTTSPALAHPNDARPPPAKRPKLSLTTSTVPLTFGRSSTTGLGSSPSTDSPTLRNTYVNAYQPPRRLTSTTSPSTPLPTTLQQARGASQSPVRPIASPYRQEAPYKIALGIRGILRNGPLPRRHFSATSARTPRKLFPDIKHVSYRSPLEEVVPAESPLSDIEEVFEDETSSGTAGDIQEDRSNVYRRTVETESHTGSDDDPDSSGIMARACRKRRREWVWTLEDSPELAGRNAADLDESTQSTIKSDIRISDGLGGDLTTTTEAQIGDRDMIGKESATETSLIDHQNP